VRWPTPTIPVILALTGQYLATGRDAEAYGYFRERAAAAPDHAILVALAGGQEAAFVRSGRALLEQGGEAFALKLSDLGLLNYPVSRALTELRRHALDRLRVREQALNPFKFIVYSEWAGADLPPLE
jgi:hypothetical protein